MEAALADAVRARYAEIAGRLCLGLDVEDFSGQGSRSIAGFSTL
jgi:hypothetical protein